jgi:hypothetical protein
MVNFRAEGRGEAWLNDFSQRLLDASIEIDRRGALSARFRTERGRPMVFTGNLTGGDRGVLRADVVSDDNRLRGQMTLWMDGRGNVDRVSLEGGGAGRDRLRLNWERR